MGLTSKKEQQLREMPLIQSRIKTSKNGKFVIQQTVITTIKPLEYHKAIVANAGRPTEEPLSADELLIEEGEALLRKMASN
jgi:hypothetical protein